MWPPKNVSIKNCNLTDHLSGNCIELNHQIAVCKSNNYLLRRYHRVFIFIILRPHSHMFFGGNYEFWGDRWGPSCLGLGLPASSCSQITITSSKILYQDNGFSNSHDPGITTCVGLAPYYALETPFCILFTHKVAF